MYGGTTGFQGIASLLFFVVVCCKVFCLLESWFQLVLGVFDKKFMSIIVFDG